MLCKAGPEWILALERSSFWISHKKKIDQGPEEATVGALADVLRQSTVWYFWWD